jgi:hypothetical protein
LTSIIFLVVFAIGWIAFAQFLPPPSPNQSARETAAMITGNRDGIRNGAAGAE